MKKVFVIFVSMFVLTACASGQDAKQLSSERVCRNTERWQFTDETAKNHPCYKFWNTHY